MGYGEEGLITVNLVKVGRMEALERKRGGRDTQREK
jgi:hypothetical protein